jgi:hypothetical protein
MLRTALLSACLALLALACAQAAADGPKRETKIKAAIVYKLAKFVDWPDARSAAPPRALNLCLLGQDPIAGVLAAAEGREIRGRRVRFRRLADLTAEGDGCHLLFVSASEAPRLERTLAWLDARPVLSISDIAGFAARGGVVGLVRSGKRLGFEINVAVAERSGLAISAPLLELATVVGPRP